MSEPLLLWLFVVTLGVAFGAGLYEHRIVVPRWLDGGHWKADEAKRDDTGRKFWGMVTTLPLTLLTVLNLVAAWRTASEPRTLWLAAGGAALGDRLLTFGYFIPTMVRLMASRDSEAAVTTAKRWSMANTFRHALVLAAWLLALRVFAQLA
jgi:hypothetical protein